MWFLLACLSAAERGDKAWAAQDIDGAIKSYASAGALSQVQTQRYARALVAAGDKDGAEEAMETVRVLSADGWVVQVLLEEDPAQALQLAEAALAEFAEPALFLNACSLALQLGDGGAMERCTQAALVVPQDPLPRLAMAEISLREGLLPSARELLESAGQMALSRDQRLWLVSLWGLAGDPKEACSAGLVLDEPLYSVAAACLSAQHPAGEAMLGQLNTPEAAALRLRLALGRAEHAAPGPSQIKQIAIANAALRQCQGLHESPGVLTDAARLALLEGEAGQAEDLLRRALTAQPPELAPWLNLSRFLARSGREEEALDLLSSAPSFGPTEDLALGLELHQLQQASGALDPAALDALLDECARQGQARCLAEGSYLMAIEFAAQPARAAHYLDQAVLFGGAPLGLRALREPVLLPVLRSPELQAWDRDPRFADIRIQAQKMPTR